MKHKTGHKRTRAAGAGAADRLTLLASLTARIADAAHDLFTRGPGLGHHAGNTYARTTSEPQTLAELAELTGAAPAETFRTLARLTEAGVLKRMPSGWRRYATDRRRAAAARRGVNGRLTERAARYSIERELWAWWQAEDEWMRAPRRPDIKHRPGRGQLSLLPEDGTHAYGPHPRRTDGRLDWRAARREVENERGGVARRQRLAGHTEEAVAALRASVA